VKRMQLSRRTVLRGAGVSMALPALEIMAPRHASAQAANTPLRFLVCYAPNGFRMSKWKPTATGTTWTTPPLLAKMEPFRSDFSMISGLGSYPASIATAFGGSHTRACAAMLTQQPIATTGVRNGISLDQLIANSLKEKIPSLKFPSLQLGGRASTGGGNCEDQYSCAYNTNLSWTGPTTFAPKQTNPLDVFNRLFAGGAPMPMPGLPPVADNKALYQKSILDVVHARATALNKLLGKTDQAKVTEYFNSVRELEIRIAKSIGQPVTPIGQCTLPPPPKAGAADTDLPLSERLDLLSDVLALAFQCDTTRVATFMYEHSFSDQRNLNFIPGVTRRHHALSHLGNPASMAAGSLSALAELDKIQGFYVDKFVYLLGKLKAMKEGNGTVLDNSIILFTSEFGDGYSHNMRDLPVLVAGKGGGKLKTGLHVDFPLDPGEGTGADGKGNPKDKQLAALLLNVLHCFGMPMASYGSDGKGTPIATAPISEIMV
jgi:hypothetical protein